MFLSLCPCALTSLLLLTTSTPISALPQSSSSSGQDAITAAYANETNFRQSVMNVTTQYREQHNASRIAWNDTLAEFAAEIVKDCKFEHSGGPYGENLGSGYESGAAAVGAWGNESEKYDFRAAEFDEETGHFTQLVWKNTTSVGCAAKSCNGGTSGGEGDAPGWFVACEYWPRGNVIGQFKDNVQARTGSAEEGAAGILRVGWAVVVGVVVGVMGVL